MSCCFCVFALGWALLSEGKGARAVGGWGTDAGWAVSVDGAWRFRGCGVVGHQYGVWPVWGLCILDAGRMNYHKLWRRVLSHFLRPCQGAKVRKSAGRASTMPSPNSSPTSTSSLPGF